MSLSPVKNSISITLVDYFAIIHRKRGVGKKLIRREKRKYYIGETGYCQNEVLLFLIKSFCHKWDLISFCREDVFNFRKKRYDPMAAIVKCQDSKALIFRQRRQEGEKQTGKKK